MVLKLYGTARSGWVRLVATVLLEKKVPFEFILVDFSKREHKSPEYLSKHPFGQVPYIVSCLLLTGNPADSMRSFTVMRRGQDDDGFILYESKAICYYIALKYANQGTPLLPTGVEANALYQQAVFVEANHFHVHAGQAVSESIYKRYVLSF